MIVHGGKIYGIIKCITKLIIGMAGKIYAKELII